MLLAGNDFILHVTGVFTRIRSGATMAVDHGGMYRSDLLRGGGRGADEHKCKSVLPTQSMGLKTLRGSASICKVIKRRTAD
jgi:hypothetical protein